MNNLTQRFLTATIGAAIMIGGILWNMYSFSAVLFLLSVVIHFEYMKTIQQFKSGKLMHVEWILIMLAGCYFFISLVLPSMTAAVEFSNIFYFIPFLSLIFIFELFANRENPFQNISLNIAGLFYCVMPFALLSLLGNLMSDWHGELEQTKYTREYANGSWLVLGYFFIVWSNDVFAYFAGRAFGKHKLFERVSPNKTWEGFFGGMIAAIACSIGLSYYLDFLSLIDWLGIAFIVAIFGTLGDLTESMLKRSLHLKDSSSILPGHGGFLDRFDATLIAAPIVFIWLMIRI